MSYEYCDKTINMILKVFFPAVFLLIELCLVKCQWYGGYDAGQYGQQYVIYNPYGPGYDDIYSQFSTYPYNDPQFYNSYAQSYNYPAQPIVIVVNNERDIDFNIDDILPLLFPVEDKCARESVYAPPSIHLVIESHDSGDCGCKKCECICRCDCQDTDHCPYCDTCNKNKCKCKDDCQCKKKKERNQKTKCKCNECQKSDCGCGGLYHKMY